MTRMKEKAPAEVVDVQSTVAMNQKRKSRTKAGTPLALAAGIILTVIRCAPAQQRKPLDIAERSALETKLESIAIIERKLMVPMRDGKRMATDVYRPKDTSKKYPAIFVRTPYNFNYWDVRSGAPRDLTSQLEAVKRDYAFVEMNERGHFFSEGNYDILGAPLTDGVDAISWRVWLSYWTRSFKPRGQPCATGEVSTRLRVPIGHLGQEPVVAQCAPPLPPSTLRRSVSSAPQTGSCK